MHNSKVLIFKKLSACLIPEVFMEAKRMIGEGGCDALTQASLSALRFWSQETVRKLHEIVLAIMHLTSGHTAG